MLANFACFLCVVCWMFSIFLSDFFPEVSNSLDSGQAWTCRQACFGSKLFCKSYQQTTLAGEGLIGASKCLRVWIFHLSVSDEAKQITNSPGSHELSIQRTHDHWFSVMQFNHISTCVVCWQPLQTVCTQIRPDITSGLIWIQTVWQSDGIPEWIFQKSWTRKKSADDKKHANFPVGKGLTQWC